MRKFYFVLLLLSISTLVFSQRGKDGNYTASSVNEIVNTYTTLTANANSPTASITVANNALTGASFSGPLEPGDLILIYQVQGVWVDINNYPVVGDNGEYTVQGSFYSNGLVYDYTEFGSINNYWSAGKYEYAEVLSVSGSSTITLTCPIKNNYEAKDNYRAQVVRVPRFTNLTVPTATSLISPKWDGEKGGVVALEIEEDLNIQGTGSISADSSGFRGGVTFDDGNAAGGPGSIADVNTRGYLGSFSPAQGAEKGESIFGNVEDYNILHSRYGYGAIANGGGGGGYHNAGGGGGSNVGTGTYYGYGIVDRGPGNAYDPAWNLEDPTMITTPSGGGGRGGYSHAETNMNPLVTPPHHIDWGPDFRRISGGVGGHPLVFDQTRAFMGGGGGGGHQNNSEGGDGGAGGGVVFISVYGNVTGNGTISANGQDGENAEGATPFPNGKTGDDGAGGAGGGGAIVINNINPLPASLNLIAKGGKGGDQIFKRGALYTVNEMNGPGGGGAGGMIAYTLGTPAQDVSGGAAGIASSTLAVNFPVNGATGGAKGMDSQPTFTLDILVENDTICSGETSTLVAAKVGNIATSPSLSWYENYFGGVALAAGNTFTTPPLTTTTTYYVGLCPNSFRVPVTVVVSPEIDITGIPPTITPETCAGNDGTITGIVATGGFGNLTYEWNGNPSVDIDLTGVGPGTYTLEVTDENECSSTVGPFTVGTSSAIVIDVSNIVITDANCTGGDGGITGITVSGTTGTVVYSWSPSGGGMLDLTGVNNGSHTLTISDDSGCSTSSGPHFIDKIGGPLINDANVVITDAECGDDNGSISGIIATGTGLSYEWSPSNKTTLDVNDLAAGVHSLEVTDGAGCTASAGPYTVNSSSGPVLDANNIVVTNETCHGNDGSIVGITVSGGTGTLTFEWNGISSPSADLDNAVADTYTLTVTDVNGCSDDVGPFTISTASSPIIDASGVLIVDESCSGNDGSITGITVTGGTGTLTYDWNGASSPSTDLINAVGGSYTITVTDVNGCSDNAGPFVVGASPGPSINIAGIVISDESCDGNDGSITGVSVSGGTTPYTYEWNGNASVGSDLTGVAGGAYTLVVTDAGGCSATAGPFTINSTTSITVDESGVVISDESCSGNDGSITGIVATGTGLTYAWSPSNATTIDASNLSAGSHSLIITDGAGCSVTVGPYVVSGASGPVIDASGVIVINESCYGNDGSITGITVTGGATPLTYDWNGNVSSSTNLGEGTGGTYTLTVTDANGCSTTAGPFTISSPVVPSIDITTPNQVIDEGESVNISSTYTPSDAVLSWTPSNSLDCSDCPNPTATPSSSTMYVVTVTSVDGCISQDSIYIEINEPCGEIQLPTVFSPNNDGLNDRLCVIGGCVFSMHFQVFNRWGEKIFESMDVNDCWDGTYRGDAVNTGVYIYKITGVKNDGSKFESSGNVNLLR